MIVAFYAVLFAAHAAWPQHVGDVFLGVMLMVPPFGIAVVVAGDPSAASWSRGADAEEWTGTALRKALSSGYSVVHDVQLGNTNADHVIVGPVAVIVVETKWSSKPWAGPGGYDRIRSASRQAKNAARLVSRLLAKNGISVIPEPLVVLWGGQTDEWSEGTAIRTVEGVTIVAGIHLGVWVRSLPTGVGTTMESAATVRTLQSAR